MNIDGLTMYVSGTADQGVVGRDTFLHFTQKGSRVLGRYSGGSVRRGCLVGSLAGDVLTFRYTQVEATGEIHGGSSVCDVLKVSDGRTRIIENFTWRTRAGSGANIFDEVER